MTQSENLLKSFQKHLVGPKGQLDVFLSLVGFRLETVGSKTFIDLYIYIYMKTATATAIAFLM